MISKVLEDFNFKIHGSIDVDDIARRVSKYTTQWFENTSRQGADNDQLATEASLVTKEDVEQSLASAGFELPDMKVHPHKDTNSFFIYEHSANWLSGQPYKLEHRSSDPEMTRLVNRIVGVLENIHHGKVGKTLFIKLPAGKNVGLHPDAGDYLGAVRRHHIPIITNPGVTFSVGGETIHMETGTIYEINNNRPHEVKNEGGTDRIHLLVDILPYKHLVN